MQQADISLVGVPDSVCVNAQKGLSAHFGSLVIDLPEGTVCGAAPGAMRINAALRHGVWTATKIAIFTVGAPPERSAAVTPIKASPAAGAAAAACSTFATLSRNRAGTAATTSPSHPANPSRLAAVSSTVQAAPARPTFTGGDDSNSDIPF